MSKRCGRCGQTKPDSEFHRWKRGDGRQAWCKDCRRKYDAAYHARTREQRLEQRRRRRSELREWYVSLKRGKPCADCGGTFDPAAMQWDHLPGTEKLASVGDLHRKSARARILVEIEKCELVCANCHAMRTLQRRNGA